MVDFGLSELSSNESLSWQKTEPPASHESLQSKEAHLLVFRVEKLSILDGPLLEEHVEVLHLFGFVVVESSMFAFL